jgi:tRNA G46 methylase TrmB
MNKFADDASLYEIGVHEVHEKLPEIVERHVVSLGLFEEHSLVAGHTQEAFEEATAFVDQFYRKSGEEGQPESSKLVILDSGCGKGLSTFTIASQYPHIPVIGVDRSINRLSKSEIFNESHRNEIKSTDDDFPQNALLLRAELANFWALVVKDSNWVVHSHYVLYPNPYPKAKHIGRRWHGHPIFPYMLVLGGSVKVRSNWDIYCEETKLAAETALPYFPPWFASEAKISSGKYIYDVDGSSGSGGDDENTASRKNSEEDVSFVPVPMTHFERKYMHLDVQLHEARMELPRVNREQRRDILKHLRTEPAERTD